jgi:hypothetical protein
MGTGGTISRPSRLRNGSNPESRLQVAKATFSVLVDGVQTRSIVRDNYKQVFTACCGLSVPKITIKRLPHKLSKAPSFSTPTWPHTVVMRHAIILEAPPNQPTQNNLVLSRCHADF